MVELIIPPFNDPPEAILWGSRLFVLPNSDNYGHRHVRDLPAEKDVVFYVEAWGYVMELPKVK